MRVLKINIAFCLAAVLLLSLISCKKTANKTTDHLLTAHDWIYADYIIDYSKPTSIMVFNLEKTNNALDLSLNVMKFKMDKTFEESIGQDVVKTGTWGYNSELEIEVKDLQGGEILTIITLDPGFFTWTNKTENTFATMATPE